MTSAKDKLKKAEEARIRLLYLGVYYTQDKKIVHLYFRVIPGFKPEKLPEIRSDLFDDEFAKACGVSQFGTSKELYGSIIGRFLSVAVGKEATSYVPSSARLEPGESVPRAVSDAWNMESSVHRVQAKAHRALKKERANDRLENLLAPVGFQYRRLRAGDERAAFLGRVFLAITSAE